MAAGLRSREGVAGLRGRLSEHPGDRPRDLILGTVGVVLLAAVLVSSVGTVGVGVAVVVGIVWYLFGGPYGYVVGQVLVGTVVVLPLDSTAFLPVQFALLLVCFGRLLGSIGLLSALTTVVGSVVVVGALLVISLGSFASLWQASLLVLFATAVATALFLWYDPASGTVEDRQ